MQSSALYNPRAHATPRQLRASDEHRARMERMHRAPKVDAGIVCSSASARSDSAAPYRRPARPLVVDYSCMWFYDLVFGTEAKANEILQSQPKILEIQRIVAEFYDITVAEILSPRRNAMIVRPRQIAYYLSKRLTNKSFPEIGRRFNRDHTSALSGIRKIERLRKTDETLNIQLNTLARKLGGALA